MCFKDDPAMPIADIMKSVRELKDAIPQIRVYTEGTNCSTEGLSKGYTHGFTIHFDNEADRDAYLVHEKHKYVANNNIVPNLKNGLDSILVFDYEITII